LPIAILKWSPGGFKLSLMRERRFAGQRSSVSDEVAHNNRLSTLPSLIGKGRWSSSLLRRTNLAGGIFSGMAPVSNGCR